MTWVGSAGGSVGGTSGSGALRPLLPGATLVLLTCALFVTSLPGTFLVDDWMIVAENPLVAGLDVRGIFASDYWGPGASNGQYRPLTVLSYAVNRALFGPGAFSFHVVNILLHAAACVALSSLATALTFPTRAAWLAAALFAAHPIHLEAVNMIVGRAELLAALFGLLFLILARSDAPARRRLGLLCLLAAFLSKESAAVLPLLLVLIDRFTAGEPGTVRGPRRRYYLAVAAVTAGWGLLLLWVRASSGGPVSPIDPHDNPLAFLAPVPRLLSALKVQVLYLARHVAPIGLHGVYDGSSVTPVRAALSPWGFAAAAFAAAAVAALLLSWRRRSRVAIGLLVYGLGFAVTANVLFPHYVMMADRLAYFPSAGFCLVIAALLSTPDGWRGVAPRRRWREALGVAYLAALGLVTVVRNPDYEDPARLWEKTAASEPENARAWIYLGDVRGRGGDLTGAEAAYRAAVRAAPGFHGGWNQLAYVLQLQGKREELIAVLRRQLDAVGRDLPDNRLTIAQTLLEMGRAPEALEELEKVTNPDFAQTRRELQARAVEQLKAGSR